MNGKWKSSSRPLPAEARKLEKAVRKNMEGLGYGG